jgi:hypothetical protein
LCFALENALNAGIVFSRPVAALHMQTRMHMPVLPPASLYWFDLPYARIAVPAWFASLPRLPGLLC